MNIRKLKFNCSQIGSLLANSKDNKPLTEKQWEKLYSYINLDKLTPSKLSELRQLVSKQVNYSPESLVRTTKQELIRLYAWNKYKKGTVGSFENMAIEKGTISEKESIELLSKIDGINYKKNKRLYSNDYLKGKPDIVIKKPYTKIIEIKSSFDVNSFLYNIDYGLPTDYEMQMLGYLEITGAEYGEVCFCLVNTPPEIIEQQIRFSKQKYFLNGKSDEDLEKRIKFINDSMIFDDIPEKRRIIRYSVDRNQDKIAEIYERVEIARKWLLNFNKNHIFGKK